MIERDHALELSPPHLSAPGHREGIEKANEIREFVLGHRVAGERFQLASSDDRSFDGNDARADQLSQNVVGDTDHADVIHRGVCTELIIDLTRIDANPPRTIVSLRRPTIRT